MVLIDYLYGFGFGMSFDWSSQTGAGSRNGGCGGGGAGVVVGGRIGPVFVLKSTRIENAVETNIDTKTNRTHIIYNEYEKKKKTHNKIQKLKTFLLYENVQKSSTNNSI